MQLSLCIARALQGSSSLAPRRVLPHVGEQRCPRENTPRRWLTPRTGTYCWTGSAGCHLPSSSSLLRKAGPEPVDSLEAGQVLRCKENPRGQTVALRPADPPPAFREATADPRIRVPSKAEGRHRLPELLAGEQDFGHVLQLRRFLLHAAHALLHRRRPAGAAPPGEGDRGAAVPTGRAAPAGSSEGRLPPGPGPGPGPCRACRWGSGWQRLPPTAASAHLSGAGHSSPRQARIPRRFPCYCVTGRRRDTWLQPPQPQPGSPRQQRPRPAVTRQGRRCLTPREGAGSLPGGCEPAPLRRGLLRRSPPRLPRGSGGKGRGEGGRARRSGALPCRDSLPAGTGCPRPPPSAGPDGGEERSGEAGPAARWALGWRLWWDAAAGRSGRARCASAVIRSEPGESREGAIGPDCHPQKLLLLSHSPDFCSSATRGYFQTLIPCAPHLFVFSRRRMQNSWEGRGGFRIGNGKCEVMSPARQHFSLGKKKQTKTQPFFKKKARRHLMQWSNDGFHLQLCMIKMCIDCPLIAFTSACTYSVCMEDAYA